MVSSKTSQVLNVMHRLCQYPLGHFLEKWIHVEFSFVDTLFATVVKRTRALGMLLADLVILSCELLSTLIVLTLNDVRNEHLLFVLAQLFLLLPYVLVFSHLILVFAIKVMVLSRHIVLIFRIFVFLGVHFARGSIHDPHQRLLVASKIHFIRRKDGLKLFLLIFLVFLASKFTHLVDRCLFIHITEDAHVLP